MSNVLNLNGSCLTLPTLALIAEMLERSGEVVVKGCAVRSDAPVAKSLGFEVFREERDGYWHTSIEHIKPPFTAHQFSTPADADVSSLYRDLSSLIPKPPGA